MTPQRHGSHAAPLREVRGHDPKVRSQRPAPGSAGPSSLAIVAGGFVFCSGTAGIDTAAGTVRDGIEAQTEQAL
jgi:enamine deaminase RidA (YjgF/YER057c/UK114 family)